MYKFRGNHCKNTVYFPNCQTGGNGMEVGRNKENFFCSTEGRKRRGKNETKTRKQKTLNKVVKKNKHKCISGQNGPCMRCILCTSSNFLGLTCLPDTQLLALLQLLPSDRQLCVALWPEATAHCLPSPTQLTFYATVHGLGNSTGSSGELDP